MNKLLIAALALGAAAFVTSAISAPAAARLTPGSDGLMQKADDRQQDQNADRGDLERQGDWWGRGGPSWRDSRPWSDDEWRRGPDWNEEGSGPDED
ncbi:hypothetical protein [Methylocystis hirsuta]|uniref:Uncharacterized protein n=1 Tax=Methylocystis hirsuta TaxID=369798 RepID=A0A3M9XVX7_9HYPH|nr:hypothetical protein [Methylocystis hirsuta]MBI5013323.1 hypothetical protein [Methylocystis sp.]MBI5314293.1 hypothetical protein [Methylocystis sp.]RNJ51776.1 hypothetical protein D1O30_13035 [Methylocystis hirsuta]